MLDVNLWWIRDNGVWWPHVKPGSFIKLGIQSKVCIGGKQKSSNQDFGKQNLKYLTLMETAQTDGAMMTRAFLKVIEMWN